MTSATAVRETSSLSLKVAAVAVMISCLDVAMAVLMGVIAVSCNVANSNFAPDNACLTNSQCTAPTGVCNVEAQACVQCLPDSAAACVGTTPLCGSDSLCRGCSKHADCASAVCLGDGACAGADEVAYVAAAGTGALCSQGVPCGTLAAALGQAKRYVKVAAGGVVKDSQTTVIDGKVVTIVADVGAKLDRDGDGSIVEIRNTGAEVTIYDLEITGASGDAGANNGITVAPGGTPTLSLVRVVLSGNQGNGISATGGTVSVARSTVSGNAGGGISASGGMLTVTQSTVSGNQGGGISAMNATFEITNNFIYRNGNSTGTTVGGVNLAVSVAANNRLEFNTIVDNEIANSTTAAGGLTCDIAGFSAANNIIARNFVNRMPGAANANTVGQCLHLTSRVAADLTGLPFVSPDTEPLNYHLAAGSSAIDQATTASTVIVDVDGDSRPQGAQKDIGADEYKAN